MTAASPLRPSDEEERRLALDTRRSVIVQAPAGSGKTELLTLRLLKLLAEVDEPEQILAITFTRAATAEMRSRVLRALEEAEAFDGEPPSDSAKLARTLAQAALRNDARKGWRLLQHPQRLNIQSIDSLSLAIAHQTPLLSRLGGSLTPTEDAGELYALAARRTLSRLGEEGAVLGEALQELLRLRAASLSNCQDLIAGMLERRDQWGRAFSLSANPDWPRLRAALEEPLQAEQRHAVEQARSFFFRHRPLLEELLQCVRYAALNLQAGATETGLPQLRRAERLEDLSDLPHWSALCRYLLTAKGDWRKQWTSADGLPRTPEGRQWKERIKKIAEEIGSHPEALGILRRIHGLPPAAFDPEQWRLLQSMLTVLRHAVAELRVLFAERNAVDFVEIGMAAFQALSDDEGGSSELAAAAAGQWRHLLVDEFQDTSRSQFETLAMLAAAWESGDPGSCFLVGDPMQSIYLFRQADVELFESTRRQGFGDGPSAVQLSPVRLQTNFRSSPAIVERLNEIFGRIFAASIDSGRPYRVPFAPSSAASDERQEGHGVTIWPIILPADAGEPEKSAARAREALEVVGAIRNHWPSVLAAEKSNGEFRIAVLVRAKVHLAPIAEQLRREAIPFRAVEIENLGQRQEILDLSALVRALLHPMDRIAWLSVLRAPWCGLTLADLHLLCGSDEAEFARRPMLALLRSRLPLLSPEGRGRAERTAEIMEQALAGRRRHACFSRWVERVWITLGGHLAVDGAGYENALTFFSMLAEIPPDAAQLERKIGSLFAQPDPRAGERCGVQLMTIHKAKGLGFDVVLVPGLGRKTGKRHAPLLRWLERTRLEGAVGTPGEGRREGREFLAAPIGRKGEQGDSIYKWLGSQMQTREDEEAKRLLYVACTRARSALHLFGTAAVKKEKDGQEAIEPARGSLLATAWPALEQDFLAAWRRSTPPQEPDGTRDGYSDGQVLDQTARERLRLRRLPLQSLVEAPLPLTLAERDGEMPAGEANGFIRPEGSLAARAFGLAVHALLEEVAILAGQALQSSARDALLGEMQRWGPRALALLRNAGAPPAIAERQAAQAVRALSSALEDDVGWWILGPHAEAQTEISWSMWSGAAGGVKTLRGDRIFCAGAEPCSTGDSHLWIVDYKTTDYKTTDYKTAGPASDPDRRGAEAFFQQERSRYLPQLEAYGQALRRVQTQARPLRLALYYPLAQRLLSWSPVT